MCSLCGWQSQTKMHQMNCYNQTKVGTTSGILGHCDSKKDERYAYTIATELENISGGSRDPNKILKILST